MKILAAGQLVADIDQYNRIHEMMSMFVAKESRINDAAEEFGNYWDPHDWVTGKNVASKYDGVDPNSSLVLLFKPLSGLLNQSKMLPLRFCPITIELELVDSYDEPVLTIPTYTGNRPKLTLQAVSAAEEFTAVNCSRSWFINNVQVKCDVCTLDNALDNSYA